MSFRGMKAVLLACSGAAALIAATADANAGGLAVREQSAWGQGTSYAGVAAGGDLSAMFWNPATMTQMPGIQSESSLSGIIPYSANTATSGTLLPLGGTGNTALSALVPSSYYSWQVNPNLWLGLSVNAPFGLQVDVPDSWAGRDYGAGGSQLKTYNAAPSIAYKINDWISVGAGIQIQYASADFAKGIANIPTWQVGITGAGWGYGFTLGATLTPTPTTTIGIGYRSAINQKINGSLTGPVALSPISTYGSVNTTLNLPDVVSVGLRQKLSPQWTALATIEWTNWSRIGTSAILQPNGAPATVAFTPVALPFQFSDGWFYSVGAEYQWNEKILLRAGAAYEKSPITDDVRIPVLPDNDRYWLSFGATYKYSPKLSFDFAYSHVFVKSTDINITNTSNPWFIPGVTLPYTGTVDSRIDIISVAMTYRWDEPAPSPVKQGYFKAK